MVDYKKQKYPTREELTPEVTSLTSISSPVENLGDNLSGERAKVEAASLIGATSDQVLTGSPAQEYGSTGRFALDGMIQASKDIAREKYRATHDGEDH